MDSVVVDAAGAAMGGASRLLSELRGYLASSRREDTLLLGLERSLDPGWLLAREAHARGSARRIALNNVSFFGPGGHRTVLLRNALHFPLPGEETLMSGGSRRRVAAQAGAVRIAAARADLLVAPSSSMADRVQRWLPRAAARTVVWGHPVSPRTTQGALEPGLVVCPVLFAPYKGMGAWLRLLVAAASVVRTRGWEVRLQVTATREELAAEGLATEELVAVGRLDAAVVDALLARAQVVFYPTTVESFGYPLAEARVNGQPVLAADTAHNREVAGPAHFPFVADVESLADALQRALNTKVAPDQPETPRQYFERLLGSP